ncbi:sialate O-acetylesterase [Pedobacter sp. AW1-32]|uniref:sialate O-acetylesterase n=1 Tax=Pedobacter sp. AW1-32 TaxID=3383026 RepID=UPI003FF1094B
MIRNLLFILLLSVGSSAFALVKLPSFFGDNMVLQQNTKVKIWGWGSAGQSVVVKTSWDEKKYKAKTDETGNWQLWVNTPAAGGPYTLHISEKNTVVLNNILIGEVWICSGQSNMDMPVKGYGNLPIAHSADLILESPNSNLRLFHVERAYSDQPQNDVKGEWNVADAQSVANFSAVGYQFALMLQKHLGVPVGIIQSTWGGSPIEAWTDKKVLEDLLGERLKTDRAISKAIHQTPGNLYNAMIRPLEGFSIAGVIWYQGEQNRHNNSDYLALQMAMVKDWRKHWNIGDWPFYTVQIAPMNYGKEPALSLPLLREAQVKLTDSLVNTGIAVSMDVGEEHNIHPANKTPISKRLAALALAQHYHIEGIAAVGPRYASMQVKADTITLKFLNTPLGLTSYGKTLTQFEIAGADRVYHPAKAKIKDSQVMVFNTEVHNPIAVRYAFKDWIVGELYSTEGMPAPPFRTDNW